MNSLINKGILSGLLLFSAHLFSQVKLNQSPNQDAVQMESQNDKLKEYILLVHLPLNYGQDHAKEVREQWNQLLDKWKADGTYLTSFVYPNDGYLVTGPEKIVTEEGVISGDYKLISNLILRASNYQAAVMLAKACPVLKQGGRIEVREIQPRPQSGLTAPDSLQKNKEAIRHQ